MRTSPDFRPSDSLTEPEGSPRTAIQRVGSDPLGLVWRWWKPAPDLVSGDRGAKHLRRILGSQPRPLGGGVFS
jgi:hypothetical protein